MKLHGEFMKKAAKVGAMSDEQARTNGSVVAGHCGPVGVTNGYKHTEMGVIPEDWNHMRIGDLASVKGGKRLPPGFSLLDVPTPHPYLRVCDMYPGGIDQSAIKFVPEKAFPAIKNYRIYSDEIFVSVAGTLGIVGIVPPALSGAILTENADRITNLRCDRDFLMHWLMSWQIQAAIESIRTVSAQPKLALGRIAEFEISIPKRRAEQCAIAEVLSDVDRLLESLVALIAKKRDIKQAAMQQLLTGETRLPGFSGKWETKRLEELAQIDPENLSSDTHPDHKFNYIALEQVDTGRLCGYTVETFRTAPSRARRVLRRGDIIMSTVRPNLMSHLFFRDQVTGAVCSTGFAVIRYLPNLSVPGFLFAHLFGHVVNRQIQKMLAGSNYPAIASRDVQLIEIPCPNEVLEQHAIATVLSDMDAEITALEQLRDKTIAIKQGMMQQLLTGRIRLVIEG